MKSFEKYVDRRSASEIEYDRLCAEIDASEAAEYEEFLKQCAVEGIRTCPHGNMPCPMYMYDEKTKHGFCKKDEHGELNCALLGGGRREV